MSIRVTMEQPVVVDVAPVNESTKKWGVCAIPRMWKLPDGSFILRVNGEQDTCFADKYHQAPNQYYRSEDNGTTWQHFPGGESEVDMSVVTGTEPIYCKLKNGRYAAIRWAHSPEEIRGAVPTKTFPCPSLETINHGYRVTDLAYPSIPLEFALYNENGVPEEAVPMTLDMPALEVCVNCGAQYRDGKSIEVSEHRPVPEKLHTGYAPTYGVVELADGTLLGTAWGQNPAIEDKSYGVVYLTSSVDGGRTWTIRAEVGVVDPELDFGYTSENSLAVAPDGSLLMVMRTEHCVPKEVEHMTGTMFSRSTDNGFSWTKPVAITDSSVTPHLITLDNGVIAFVYGRPGVHVRYSTDNGSTWSEPHTVIGKTLEQFTAEGVEYMDCKYWLQDSYCNTFMYPVSEDAVLLCYNDMKYDPGDGLEHRASLVRKIRFEKE